MIIKKMTLQALGRCLTDQSSRSTSTVFMKKQKKKKKEKKKKSENLDAQHVDMDVAC